MFGYAAAATNARDQVLQKSRLQELLGESLRGAEYVFCISHNCLMERVGALAGSRAASRFHPGQSFIARRSDVQTIHLMAVLVMLMVVVILMMMVVG